MQCNCAEGLHFSAFHLLSSFCCHGARIIDLASLNIAECVCHVFTL